MEIFPATIWQRADGDAETFFRSVGLFGRSMLERGLPDKHEPPIIHSYIKPQNLKERMKTILSLLDSTGRKIRTPDKPLQQSGGGS